MKILFNCISLKKGGAERVINLLANSFIKRNEVMIVTNYDTSIAYQFDNNILLKTLTQKKMSKLNRKLTRISIPMLFNLKKIILNYKPDVIISFLPEPSFRVLTLKKFCKKIRNIPIIVSVRNDPNTEYSNLIYFYIMKKLYKLSDALVLQTFDAKKYFEEKINYKGVVIYNPVSEKFIKERYKNEREKVIVAVGRLEPQKNHKLLIDAFELVNKKYNNYVLNIYGEGHLKSELQSYIDEKKLHNKVILKGQVNDIEKEIYKASVFVMSSNYEGMPNSLLEASCLGIPCVSTDCKCGGPKEILENGKNGILVEVNNVNMLANGIIKMIEDKKFANKCSINATANSKKYCKDNIVKKWEDLILDVINK